MARFEIIIKINNIDYYLDTNDVDPFNIQYAISDITDIASRNATFTKTLTIPETKNNREVFGFISDLSSDGSLFNPNKRSKAYLLVDSVVVMEGFLQLKKVIPDLNNNNTKYECVIYADNYTFFNLIKDKFLTDIDFSEYDHVYCTSSIIQSWSNNSDSGYFYPLIDSGYDYQASDIDGSKSQLVVRSFVPATYVKAIIDKMFDNVGFGYESEFFGSSRFKNLLIPFNNNTVPTSKNFIFDNSFAVGFTHSATASIRFPASVGNLTFTGAAPSGGYGAFGVAIPFNATASPYSDPLGSYDTSQYIWQNKTGLNLSTGFVLDLDLDLEWVTTTQNADDTVESLNAGTITNDFPQYIQVYRNQDPITGWVDPNFNDFLSLDSGPTPSLFSIGTYPESKVGINSPLFFGLGSLGSSQSAQPSTSAPVRLLLKIFGLSNLTFAGESTTNGTTWIPFAFTTTTGATVFTYSTAGSTTTTSEEFYFYNLRASGIRDVRIRVTQYTSGTLLGAWFNASYGPKYPCPIFGGSSKLPLSTAGGQAVATKIGDYNFHGTNVIGNYNFKLTRYTTDILNNRGPTAPVGSATFSDSNYRYARPNEKFKFILRRCYQGIADPLNAPTNQYVSVKTTFGTASYVALNIDQQAFPGVDIDYNGVIPKKVKQSDFMLSLMRMFNLYFEPSKDLPNTLIIEPREDYYLNGEVKDWTDKIDLTDVINEQVIAETQNKYTQFTYKKDTDWYNEDYTSKTNNIFGEYDYIMDNDFITGTKKIELIFSPTPMTNVRDAPGIVIPKIIKVQTNSQTGIGVAQHFDFNTRILTRNVIGTMSGGGNKIQFENIVFDSYPYAGHLDNPITPIYDINYGEITSIYNGGAFGWDRYIIPIPGDNLFNTYYSKMMDEYSNPSSKIVSLSLYLNPIDIHNFRFNNSIFLDINGVGQYYKVLKIDGYDPTSNGKTSKVDLLKTIYVSIPKNINSDDGFDFQKPGYGGTPIYVAPYTEITSGLMSNGNNNSRDRDTLVLGQGNTIGRPGIVVGENNIVSAPNSLVSGENNSVVDSVGVLTIGSNNDLETSNKSVVIGDNNEISNGSTGLIFGSTNSVINNANVMVFGDYNTASHTSNVSVVFGMSNIIGENNDTPPTDTSATPSVPESSSAFIFGSSNVVGTSSNNSVIFGSNNIVGHGITSSFIIGNGIIATQSNTIYIGGSGSTVIISGSVSDAAIFIDLDQIAFGTGTGITSSSDLIFDKSAKSIIGGYNNKLYGSATSIIIGDYNSMTQSISSIVVGSRNIMSQGGKSLISGCYNISCNSYDSSITGLQNKIYNSYQSSILSGSYHSMTSSAASSIIGGQSNSMSTSQLSVVLGSYNSMTSSNISTILGGKSNEMNTSSYYSSIIGGKGNSISIGYGNSVIGGRSNKANGFVNAVFGGGGNQVCTPGGGQYTSIIGGVGNKTIDSYNASIVGGLNNYLFSVNGSSIFGGSYNSMTSSNDASIVGGFNNYMMCSDNSLISGGFYNSMTGSNTSLIIGGQRHNMCNSVLSTIIGGRFNSMLTNNYTSSILGGFHNCMSTSPHSSIITGSSSFISNSKSSSIFSGYRNTISSADNSVILGGSFGTVSASSCYSSLVSGNHNIVFSSNNASIIGGEKNTISNLNNSIVIGSYDKQLNQSINGKDNSTLVTNFILTGSMSTINGATYSVGFNGSTTILGTTLTIVNGLIVNVS